VIFDASQPTIEAPANLQIEAAEAKLFKLAETEDGKCRAAWV
jgi:hypothetical protein